MLESGTCLKAKSGYGALGLRLTTHASVRMRQWGINALVLDCLLRYCYQAHDHRGAVIVIFDKAALEKIRRHEQADLARAAVDSRELYAVVGSDG